MADDESVKLQSGDNEVFSVSKEVACQAVTIKEMLEGARALPLSLFTHGGEGGKGKRGRCGMKSRGDGAHMLARSHAHTHTQTGRTRSAGLAMHAPRLLAL